MTFNNTSNSHLYSYVDTLMYTRTPCKKLNCYIQKSLCKAGLIFIDDEITIVKCYIALFD